ncbi:LysM domain containing protein [Naviculisporaceae sp. PSN 640]
MTLTSLSYLAVGLLALYRADLTAAQSVPAPASTHPGTSASCTRWHVVGEGNTCPGVEAQYGITHGQFLSWNPAVSSDCVSNFWGGFAYCVSITPGVPPGPTLAGTTTACKRWHVVQSGNTCATLEAQYGITRSQFLTWNPAVSSNCESNFWAYYAYCVGTTVVTTTTSSSSSTRSSTATPVTTGPPGPTMTDAPANCNGWHLIATGDDCDNVASRYGLTRAQFIAMNPSISEDCSAGFWLEFAYCVRLGPAMSSTSSSTGSIITSSSSSISSSTSWFNSTYSIQHPTTSWAITTPARTNSTWPPTATQPGQPAFCNDWHLVLPGQDCLSIIIRYGARNFMSSEDFYAWNPTVQEDCSGLYIDHWVCVGIEPQDGLTIEVPIPTETPSSTSRPPLVIPTPPPEMQIPPFDPTPFHGTPPTNCRGYYQARENETCNDAVRDRDVPLTTADFFLWNPALNNDCNGLWAGYYYCVNARDQASDMPDVVTVLPEPVLPGTAPDCVAWYQAIGEDECWMLPYMFGTFSLLDFVSWNTNVTAFSDGSCQGFQLNYWYCVAVPGTPTTRTAPFTMPGMTDGPEPTSSSSSSVTVTSTTIIITTSSSSSGSSNGPSSVSASSTTTSAAAVSTPQPIQAPMIAGCRRFYYVQPGDGCWLISNAAGISTDDFYLYNPAAAPDCSTMWANIYVCVGISGPMATFSGTLPVPTS